eukprot:m.10001 g.10001  ORF g.10001 m.10001 type:complete len:183 (+) comp6482_c0_seq1:114-662(+)
MTNIDREKLKAHFVEDVEEFMASSLWGKTAEDALRVADQKYRSYKLIESSCETQKKRLTVRLPDLKRTKEAIEQLQKQKEEGKEVTTTYSLADGVYANAKIANADTVCLWLGANVMLEYSLDEAAETLHEHVQQAEEKLASVSDLLDFIRDQQTTMEVNMARIYNWDVTRRRKEKEAAEQRK